MRKISYKGCLFHGLFLLFMRKITSESICPEIKSSQITPEIEYFRLPKSVIPEVYYVSLSPDMSTLDAESFNGTSIIEAETRMPTSRIMLHSLELSILNIEVVEVSENSKNNLFQNCMLYTINDYLILDLSKTIDANKRIRISINYQGGLLDKTYAIYKSYYNRKSDGLRRQMIASHHEPTYARRSFPAFDEPDFKAKFVLEMVYPVILKNDGYHSISNMPLEKQVIDEEKGLVTDTFLMTPKMPSYLATFLICDFEYIEAFSEKDNKPLRVYLTKEQNELNQGDWALAHLKHAFDYFEKLLDFPYALPKMDMIAIPNFNTGAMENWGAVTYRETALLYQENVSSINDKFRVAQVVSHELAHMWFGNLVTLNWWDEIWLNEGFASFFTIPAMDYALEKIYDREIADQWGEMNEITRYINLALSYDDTESSPQIIYSAKSKNTITAVFNTIPYKKGASFLWSLSKVMGYDNFIEAVQHYLKVNAFENVNSQNLLDSLQAINEKKIITEGSNYDRIDSYSLENFEAYFWDYLKKPGYPVFTVGAEELLQERFFENKNLMYETNKNLTEVEWTMPERYFTDILLAGPEFDYRNQDPATAMLSNDYKYFARYRYHWNKLGKIIDQLNENHLVYSELDRLQFLDDIFALAFAGYYQPIEKITKNYIWEMFPYLAKEQSNFVHYRFAGYASKIISACDNDNNEKNMAYFKELFLPVLGPLMDRLGEKIKNSDDPNNLFREQKVYSTLLSTALKLEIPSVQNMVNDHFENWAVISNNFSYSVPSDLRNLVYVKGLQNYENTHSDEETFAIWLKVLKRMGQENLLAEKLKLTKALSSVKSPVIIEKFIKFTLNGAEAVNFFDLPSSQHAAIKKSEIRRQDILSCLYYISALSKTSGRQQIKNLIENNNGIDILIEKFGLFHRRISRIIKYIVSSYDSEEELEWAKKIYQTKVEHHDLAGKTDILMGIDKIQSNIEFNGLLDEIVGH